MTESTESPVVAGLLLTFRCPPSGQPWTIEDLEYLPDGFRYEILDGSLLVSPMPGIAHWHVVRRLRRALDAQAPDHYLVGENPGIRIDDATTFLYPDIAVLHATVGTRNQQGFEPEDYALVIEVLSPSNRGNDLTMKRHCYARAGVPRYWIADPQRRRLTVLVHDGREGYVESQVLAPGDRWRTDEPYPFTVDVAEIFD